MAREKHRCVRSACQAERLENWVLLSASLVKDLNTTPAGAFDNDSSPMISFGGQVYFELGSSLYKSDGTAAGTVKLKDFGALSPLTPVQAGTELFLIAEDLNGNSQLWKTNGTSAGTAMVAVLPTIDPADAYENLTAVGNTLFFTQSTGSTQAATAYTLWKSDGSTAGTGGHLSMVGQPGAPGVAGEFGLRQRAAGVHGLRPNARQRTVGKRWNDRWNTPAFGLGSRYQRLESARFYACRQ